VLVNNPREEIDALCASGLIDTLQFHGNEPDEVLQHYQSRGMPCIRALSLREEADFEQLAFSVTNKLLLDAYHPTDFGGTGTACDWGLARQAVRQFPKQKIILSGGLSPENVAQAIRQVRPCAVDVASGVESSPGIKDAAKIQDFMRQVLAAAE
jgi:phosphoribosylanthranilate isomerase